MDIAALTNDLAIPFVQSGSYPVRAGNVVRPLVDGLPAFRRIGEAIETARCSVWATVTFMWAAFEMPDDRGTTLDVLDKAAARGVDIRIIFWRPDRETEMLKQNAFWGSAEHIAQLEARGPRARPVAAERQSFFEARAVLGAYECFSSRASPALAPPVGVRPSTSMPNSCWWMMNGPLSARAICTGTRCSETGR